MQLRRVDVLAGRIAAGLPLTRLRVEDIQDVPVQRCQSDVDQPITRMVEKTGGADPVVIQIGLSLPVGEEAPPCQAGPPLGRDSAVSQNMGPHLGL